MFMVTRRKADVTPAILSRECAIKSRNKVAYAAIVQLHAATLSDKLGLFSYNSMSCSVFASNHSISKLNKLNFKK